MRYRLVPTAVEPTVAICQQKVGRRRRTYGKTVTTVGREIRVQDETSEEVVLEGITISPGRVSGRVCMFNDARHQDLPDYTIAKSAIERELNRIDSAVNIAGRRLDRLIEEVETSVGEAEAGIFIAQKRILQDPGIVRQIRSVVADRHRNAEAAIDEVLEAYEDKLRKIDDAYISERATDIGELKRRLLDVLAGSRPSLACAGTQQCQHGRQRIVCASELSPSITVDLDTANILGFVTQRGGINSHAGILARSLGIPAISGIEEVYEHVRCGTQLLIDGERSRVIVNPCPQRLARLPSADRERDPERIVPPISRLKVAANISGPADAERARHFRAEGVGLYRTEIEVMAANRLFDEEEQYASYAAAMETMPDRPVTFRLYDFGSDKPLPGLELPPEDNPALGLRGARLLEHFPDLLRSQARAIARAAAHGEARLLYPMIIDVAQFVQLRGMVLTAIADLPDHGLTHGVMFEVPAACLAADLIYAEADFGSIGSNDLGQYLYAADRGNHLVYHCIDTSRPGFWLLLGMIADAARAHGKPLSFCGELPAETDFLERLVELGLDSVSANPTAIAALRECLGGKALEDGEGGS